MKFTLKPAKGDNFAGREKLLEDMLFDLRDGDSTTGYALYGKRRVGKTSIFKEIQRRLKKEEGVVCVYFSIWDLVEYSVPEFCRRLSMEIIDSYAESIGLKYRAKELLKTPLNLLRELLGKTELKIVYNEIEFLLTKKQDTEVDIDLMVENTFNLTEKFAKQTNKKCILFIDEFPSITELKFNGSKIGESIIRKIRTLFEDWGHTSLCITGSTRSTMNAAVLSSTSPFYRQLIVKEVKPLEERYVKELLLKNLPDISDEVINEIYKFSTGIPFYIQFLGKLLERKETINSKVVKEIENEFLEEEGNILFKEEFTKLSPKERLILLAMAKDKHSPSEMAEIIGDGVSNINRFLRYLEEKGYISKERKGYYVMCDPVFGKWLSAAIEI